MSSFAQRLPAWIRRPIFEEEGWPHDPLNTAIMLACFYVVAPLAFAASILFLFTGWHHRIPVWLDSSLFMFLLVFGWIALDEWRSRRRSADGEGHGWIWQMVERYGPRRRFNQLMTGLLLLMIVGARAVSFIDRLTTADLQYASALILPEITILTPIMIWAVIATIGWHRANLRTTSESTIYRVWTVTVFCLFAAIMILGVASVSDELAMAGRLSFGVWILIFFPGWGISALADRIRARSPSADAATLEIVPPTWW